MKKYCVKIATFHFIVLSADYGDKTCALLFFRAGGDTEYKSKPRRFTHHNCKFFFPFCLCPSEPREHLEDQLPLCSFLHNQQIH